MWGRAGRRRLDTEGYVIPCIDIEDVDVFQRIEAFPEAIQRKDFVSAVNILSILSRHGAEILDELYQKSFSSYVYKTPYKVFADHVMFRDAGAICGSPTYELPPYRQGVYRGLSQEELAAEFRCGTCPNLKSCTRVYEDMKSNRLQRMAKHLMTHEYLDRNFGLTFKGRIAERFHTEMGLLVAHDIVSGRVRPDNVVSYCTSVNASAHIDFAGHRQRAQLDAARRLYPSNLFPTLWERHRGRPAFVQWNPGAGAVAAAWINADNWEDFIKNPDWANIQGDVFRALLRGGELLRSMSYLGELHPKIAEAARVGVKQIMRPPLIPESLFAVVREEG